MALIKIIPFGKISPTDSRSSTKISWGYWIRVMKSFQQYLTTAEEIGFVEACNQSIVYASGLPNATLSEIVMFETGELGVILSLSRDQVEILLLSKTAIKA